MKFLKIALLLGGTIAVAYFSAWLMQDDKSVLPGFKGQSADHGGRPPGK